MGVPVCVQSTNLPGSQTRNRKNKLLFVVKTVVPNTYYADMVGLYGNMFLKEKSECIYTEMRACATDIQQTTNK